MSNYLDENHDANAILVAIGQVVAKERQGLVSAQDRLEASEEPLSPEQRAFIAGASAMAFKIARGIFEEVTNLIDEERAFDFMSEVVWPAMDATEAEQEAAA